MHMSIIYKIILFWIMIDDSMLLIACDGVFDVFDNYQAVQALETLSEDIEQKDQNRKEQKLSELLVNAACDDGSTDNISAIVVSLWKIGANMC